MVVVKWRHCANGLVYSLSLVTVQEGFAKVNSAQNPSRFWFAACWCPKPTKSFVAIDLTSQLETDQSESSATKAPSTRIWIFLKTEIFLLHFQKYKRSQVSYSSRFRPSIENFKQWKRNASSKWCTTSSHSKTSVFVRQHVNEKPAFSKIFSLWRTFLKT